MKTVRRFPAILLLATALLMGFPASEETLFSDFPFINVSTTSGYLGTVHEAGILSASFFRPSGGETPFRVTYKELREYRFSRRQRSPIPPKLQALNGKQIDIAGYMIPLNEAKDITEFMLIQYPFFGCCYSMPPEPNETVFVRLPKGKATEFVNVPIRVSGTFKIDDTVTDGFVVSLYKIEGASVRKTSANDPDVMQHRGNGGFQKN